MEILHDPIEAFQRLENGAWAASGWELWIESENRRRADNEVQEEALGVDELIAIELRKIETIIMSLSRRYSKDKLTGAEIAQRAEWVRERAEELIRLAGQYD